MNPKLTIIAGPPATGKTRVSRMLAEHVNRRLGMPVLHIEVDDLRHMVLHPEPSVHAAFAFDLVLCLLQTHARSYGHVVAEGLFYDPTEIDALLNLGFKTRLVLFEAPVSVCVARNRSRSHFEEVLSDDEVIALATVLRPHAWHRVDATGSPDEVMNAVLRYCNDD